MSTRNVSLQLSYEDREELAARTDYNELYWAIGYLSSWGPAYPTVRIHRYGEIDLVAAYFDENDEHAYSKTAIWHKDHYRIR